MEEYGRIHTQVKGLNSKEAGHQKNGSILRAWLLLMLLD